MSTIPARWRFKLYLADDAASEGAEAAVRRSCRKHLAECFVVEVIRVDRHSTVAEFDEVVHVPSCVRLSPAPVKQVVDLSSFEQLLV